MPPLRVYLLASLLMSQPVPASIVVISAVPDPLRPPAPLADSQQQALSVGSPVRVGAFPNLSGDDLLNLAKSGGYAAVAAAFVPFGQAGSIGAGVNSMPGRFEISVREENLSSNSSLAGQPIHLLVGSNDGAEFLIARFPAHSFIADTVTGVEPLISLLLTDASLIVGTRHSSTQFATSPPPVTGSFADWIRNFPALATPEAQSPANDPDGDGRSNFIEYAFGGNPASGDDEGAPQLSKDQSGNFWLNFSRRQGVGPLQYFIESTANPALPWQILDQPVSVDDSAAIEPGMLLIKFPLPAPTGNPQFFRLRVVGN